MELKLVIKTGRSAVVEFDDGGKYYSKEEYTLLINGEEYGKTEKVVTTIYGLKPDTEYKITAVYAGKEYGPVEFKTDYEYVHLMSENLVRMVMESMMILMQSSVRLWQLLRIPEY